MTKKHFIELADVVREIQTGLDRNSLEMPETVIQGRTIPAHRSVSVKLANAVLACTLADFCVIQNPRFNRERWLAYIAGECGPNGGASSDVQKWNPGASYSADERGLSEDALHASEISLSEDARRSAHDVLYAD